ncbi:MAG: hypothetical protein ACXAEU_14995 [Candidatus Hodarchaeales archaeon]|jgi:hypothetical protein
MIDETKQTSFLQEIIDKNSAKKAVIVVIHALIGWALCGATMIVGKSITSIDNALIIHAIAAPIFFSLISTFYYKKFNYTTPVQTAVIFTALVISLDLFIVAPIFEQSFEMFTSILGTWIPFSLILISTYLTGQVMKEK